MPALVDRRENLEALDEMLQAVRDGSSRSLVLRGEAGIGKTALLEYAIESAADYLVARVVGFESEMELGYAALHQMLSPFISRLVKLPAPQSTALSAVFGLQTAAPPDRFLVGLAVLTLLADVATEQPLLCVVDDAQWLDQESADILAFVSRRLFADRIALLFAFRNPGDVESLRGLTEVDLRGLPDEAAHKLLTGAVMAPMDYRVGDSIVADSAGNPLALLELSRGLTPEQLAGGMPLPEVLPLGRRLNDGFLARVRDLPTETQTFLLVVAAEPSGDPALLWRAASSLALNTEAATPAVAAGLLVTGSTIVFRHPLIRSAVYGAASIVERQRVHQALADALDPELDSDRRAWHHAEAAAGPDEDVALELERAANRARAHGGHAAVAAMLTRAAQLSLDEHQRATRMLAAAGAELEAGAPARAHSMLERATPRLSDAWQRAFADRLRGALRYATGETTDTTSVLLGAAQQFQPLDTGLARQTLLEAMAAAMYADRETAIEVAKSARAVPRSEGSAETASDLLLDGLATYFTEGYPPAVPILREALAALHADDDLRWHWLGCLTAGHLLDLDAWHSLATRWVQLSREQGGLTALPMALIFLGGAEFNAGRFDFTDARAREASEISAATGNPGLFGTASRGDVLTSSWVGPEADARAAGEATRRESAQRGSVGPETVSEWGLAMLELGLGHYAAALALTENPYAEDRPGMGMWVLADRIEAATRAGRPDLASDALGRFTERAAATGTPWALGLLARSRALTASDEDAEALYQAAIAHLEGSRARPDLARAHLVYGEWLRRRKRRREAREQLRAALEMFDEMNATFFATRTELELRATGERARRRSVDTRYDLTPQESQIAGLTAEGLTNREIATRLYISASTVDYHLRKVFQKLEVSSRTQLARVLVSPH